MTTNQAAKHFARSIVRWTGVALVALCALVALNFGVDVAAIMGVVGVLAAILLLVVVIVDTTQLIRTRKGLTMKLTAPWVRLAIGAAVATVLTVACTMAGLGVDLDQVAPLVQILGR